MLQNVPSSFKLIMIAPPWSPELKKKEYDGGGGGGDEYLIPFDACGNLWSNEIHTIEWPLEQTPYFTAHSTTSNSSKSNYDKCNFGYTNLLKQSIFLHSSV